jgi:hypothetical protein
LHVRGIALTLTFLLLLAMAGDRMNTSRAGSRIELPPLVLWAWDRDDDLRFIDSRDTAVAYLAATVILRGDGVFLAPRHNPLAVPEGTTRVAVIHVETDRAEPAVLDAVQMRRFIDGLAALGSDLPHKVLQIDFEALSSQRAFFIETLAELRRRLPDAAISITALASWCLTESWTGRLAADEVVPMLFRMGPDGRRVRAHFANGGDFRSASCRASLGVAADELPPALPPGRRIYVFSPRRWTAETYRTVRARIRPWSYASLPD